MRTTIIYLLAGCLLCGSSLADKAKTKKGKRILRYPVGCKPVGYQFDHFNLVLKSTSKSHPQTVYFLHNLSNQPIKMLQAHDGDKPYLMHTNTTIRPRAWGIFATDMKHVKFICAIQKNKKAVPHIIDCSKVFDVCEYPYSRFGPNHHGNYWVSSGIGSHKAAKRFAKYHGILLVDQKRKARELENEE